MDSPLLWYANRGTGAVLLVLLTLTVALGVLSTRGDAAGRMPRFVTQTLHRNLSLLSVALLAAHVTSAVVDEYVDIRWWQALVPFGASYETLWLGLGALALEAMTLVVLTSLLRSHLSHRLWRVVHLLSYVAWGLALAHGLGIGTDSRAGWAWWLSVGCAGLAVMAVAGRLLGMAVRRAHRRQGRHVPDGPAAVGVRS